MKDILITVGLMCAFLFAIAYVNKKDPSDKTIEVTYYDHTKDTFMFNAASFTMKLDGKMYANRSSFDGGGYKIILSKSVKWYRLININK
jgi:diacylglycerol kinase family enzyme